MTSNMKDASKIGSITLSYSVRRGDTLGSILPRQISLVWDYRFYEKGLLRDETLSPLHVAWNSTGLNLCFMTQISSASCRSVHIRVGIAETALYNLWSQVRTVHCRPYSVYRLVREDHSIFTPYHKTKLTDVSLLHCIKWYLRHYLRNKPTKPSWKKGNQNGFED